MSDSIDLARARRHAILCILGASAAFAAAAVCVKAVAGRIPVMEIVFFRSLFVIPALLPSLLALGGLSALRTTRPFGHLMRTVFGLIGMGTAFYGYANLPLAMVTALGFAMPLFLTVLSVTLLKETVGWRRISAVLVGFAGMLIMVRPWNASAETSLWAAMVVVVGVFFWALAMVTIRKMGASGERNVTIVIWFSIGGALISGTWAAFEWVTPVGWEWVFLIATGVISALAQMLMTEAYRSGETTLVAPFEYGAILYTMAFGFLIWGEVPEIWHFAGTVVLVLSGLYIWHREVVLKKGQ